MNLYDERITVAAEDPHSHESAILIKELSSAEFCGPWMKTPGKSSACTPGQTPQALEASCFISWSSRPACWDMALYAWRPGAQTSGPYLSMNAMVVGK